jgi:hypothetical protein
VDFWDSLILVPAVDEVDGLGTPVKVPGPDGPTVPAIVQPADTVEQTTGGQRTVTTLHCFLPCDAEVDAFGWARWGGDLYEFDGEIKRHTTPAGPHHAQAVLRKVR